MEKHESDSDLEVGSGTWDSARDSAEYEEVFIGENKRILRRHWQTLRVSTFTTAVVGLVPVILLTGDPSLSAEDFIAFGLFLGVMFSLTIAPWWRINLILVAYPIWVFGIVISINTLVGRTPNAKSWSEFFSRMHAYLGDYCSNTELNAFWLLRIPLGMYVIYIISKGWILYRLKPTERRIVQRWWRFREIEGASE